METEPSGSTAETGLQEKVDKLYWYHTLDLGNGIIANGEFDFRPYVGYFRIPGDLTGKTVLDIGAASGFFSFEMEKRGAKVTATELPRLMDHDFGQGYRTDITEGDAEEFIHHPFSLAKKILKSNVTMKYINIYEISPASVGVYDIVFCGSVLNHLKDPVNALINIAGVTREKAIIAAPVFRDKLQDMKSFLKRVFGLPSSPLAYFPGQVDGDVWWLFSRPCLEAMALAAGFKRVEWVGRFELKYRDRPGSQVHGVIHAYK